MRAAVLRQLGRPLVVEDLAVDTQLGAREVLVETVAAGVCHTDLHVMSGHFEHPLPAALGHESSGIVAAVGSQVRDVCPGDHVVASLSGYCGRCRECQSGASHLCARVGLGRKPSQSAITAQGEPVVAFMGVGGFAEQMVLHENFVVRIPNEMPLELAALLGCGVTTGMGASMNSASVRPGQVVAVLGCGGTGLSAIQGAVLAGAARVIAVDVVAVKLDAAKTFGATDLVNAAETDAVRAVLDMTDGGVDHSIEAVGNPRTIADAFSMLRVRGVATIVGVAPQDVPVPLPGRLLLGERRLQGSNMGGEGFRTAIPRLARMFLRGQLLLEEMVTHRVHLDQINDAIVALDSGDAIRPMVSF